MRGPGTFPIRDFRRAKWMDRKISHQMAAGVYPSGEETPIPRVFPGSAGGMGTHAALKREKGSPRGLPFQIVTEPA